MWEWQRRVGTREVVTEAAFALLRQSALEGSAPARPRSAS
jgi:hypothetical protein